MRILVAGGAGFIGSHLCDALIQTGHTVIAVDNFITGREVNIVHLLGHPAFTFIRHDVTEPIDLDIDRIFHLASPASPEGYWKNPIETHLVNSIGTLNLLRLAHRRAARFLFTSTSEIYGNPEIHPQPEDYFGNVNPVGPRSCYDESKRFGESITMEFVRRFGVDARIIRLFNTYGPRSDPDDGRVVPNFVMQALRGEPLTVFGDGARTRSLCYVGDVVAGLMACMDSDAARGEVFNLGNPDERTVFEIATVILKLCDSRSKISFETARPEDPERRCPDITKVRTTLGWEPRVDMETGLRETIGYFTRYVNREPSALVDQ